MRLPICVKPLPDEFWQGYIMRLAVLNNCWSLEEFESRFIYSRKRNRRSGGGYPESLSAVCDLMSDTLFFPAIEEAMAMTPYYAEAEGLSEGKQAKLAESILYNINEPVTPNNRSRKKFHLRTCQECMKRDIEKYGFWYFHLSHHLPDVCVCAEHKVPLIELGHFDKRHSHMPDFEKGREAEVPDMALALAHAEKMEEAFCRNRNVLVLKECPDCGREYLIHPYSEKTGASCPHCRNTEFWEEFIQRRLEFIHGKEYELTGAFRGLSGTVVKHLPCGLEKRNLKQLLWDKRGRCSGCRAVTLPKLQEQIDPEKKEFIIRKLYRNESDSRMVTVTHVDCGTTFDIQVKLFQENPHCVICERKRRAMENRLVHPDYEVVSEYQNNHDTISIRHKDCGCIFPTSKTAFLAGTRCPVCTNHYDFQMVSDAVAACTEGYHIEKGEKRGDVNVYFHGNLLFQDVSYSKLMCDLQEDEPKLIVDRKKKYEPPKSIRRKIYDAVAIETKEKGYWEGKDGILGEEYTRGYRNILQDLTNLGYLHRIRKGEYRINDDVYKFYDENTR